MQALYDKQRYASLPIPQTTLQRLPVEEVDGMEFYTPAETGMFAVISEQLRNCVKSYRVSAANGDIAIVGVRDKNRIVACIEVRLSGVMQPVVVQAKLADNVKLLRNEKINNALLHWAQRQNLRIKTDDVAV
jgi:Holliday junction resolvase-like predicted endonuclease